MGDDGGNGYDPVAEVEKEAFKGAVMNVADMKKSDGIFTRGLSNAQQGVLQRSMSAISKDTDYRQELKTAFFLSAAEADKFVASINEAERYGCSLKMNIDWLIARSAGVNGGRLRAIFETISHTTLTTNNIGDSQKRRWWSNDKNKNTNPLDR